MKHLDIKIYGQVQGVFFRDSAKEKAEQLGIFGFAKNEPDGTVYIEVEGEEGNLEKFLSWCKSGSRWAEVEKVESEEGDFKNYNKFEVRY